MSSAPQVLIRTDGNQAQGMGHAIRSGVLGRALRKRGCGVGFVVKDSLPAYVRQLQDERFDIETVAPEASLEEDARTVRDGARRRLASAPVMVVTDGYAFTTAYQHTVRESGAFLLCIDDLAQCEDVSQFVLNQNLWSTPAHYRHGPDTMLLLGPQYALVRDAFRSHPTASPPSPVATRIAVTFGGVDVHDQTLRMARIIEDAGWRCTTTLVAGPAYPHLARLQAWVASRPDRFSIQCNPQDMHRVLGAADVAVSAAGSTCWELCALGVPTMLIVVDDNQVENARALSAQGVFETAGWYHEAVDADIEQQLAALIVDQARRQEMARRARALVDGLGSDRVAAAMLERLAAGPEARLAG